MLMQRLSFLVALILFLSSSSEAAKLQAKPAAKNVTGTYEVTYKRGAGGLLKVLQKGNEIEFELEFNRGAPSYNSGVAGGTVAIKNGVAIFKTIEYGDGGCELVFKFQSNKVVVKQNGSDVACGFGHGVMCNGTYLLKSRKRPKFEG
jgi:hypothetical protein